MTLVLSTPTLVTIITCCTDDICDAICAIRVTATLSMATGLFPPFHFVVGNAVVPTDTTTTDTPSMASLSCVVFSCNKSSSTT